MLLSELCLHTSVERTLASFINSMPQAVLLVAEKGFGKTTLAVCLADEVTGGKKHLQLFVEPLPDTRSITIDQARQIKSFFSLRTNDAQSKRVVTIDKADTMTIEAQNSLLKILEEPPQNCHLILKSSRPQKLLSTIRSRVTAYTLISPTKADIATYFKAQGHSEADIAKAMALAGALPGLIASILKQENSDIADSISEAKNLLGLTTLERLKLVDKLTKNKEQASSLLEALKTISEAAIQGSVQSGKSTTKWRDILAGANMALLQLEQNASAKLVFTNLFLSM